jgi:AcrR family transcriptional regulator
MMKSEAVPSGNLKAEDRRVRRTRTSIRAALKRLLQDAAIDQFTVKDIAEEADIGYTTFFRHFATKEEALADLADSAAAELLTQTLPVLKAADSRASCVALCQHVQANRSVWGALLTGGAASFVRSALAKHTLEKEAEWPIPQSWIPADKGTYLATGMVVETLTWWLTHAADLAPEQVAEIMDRTFVSALVGNDS